MVVTTGVQDVQSSSQIVTTNNPKPNFLQAFRMRFLSANRV